MNDILALARPEILTLKAYSHASWDPAFDRLHANELPWRAETDRSQGGLNRYPEPHPHELAARDENTKVVFLCSPNNPTGNAMDPAAIETLLTTLAQRAIVVVDEAYI